MGCLMKNGIATYGSLPHDYYVLKINGRANSIYRRYEDALREGLLLRYQFPHLRALTLKLGRILPTMKKSQKTLIDRVRTQEIVSPKNSRIGS